MRVTVFVLPREGLLHPEGEVIRDVLHAIGFPEVQQVKMGLHYELELEDGTSSETIEEMCQKKLANPLIQDWEIRVSPPPKPRRRQSPKSSR